MASILELRREKEMMLHKLLVRPLNGLDDSRKHIYKQGNLTSEVQTTLAWIVFVLKAI